MVYAEGLLLSVSLDDVYIAAFLLRNALWNDNITYLILTYLLFSPKFLPARLGYRWQVICHSARMQSSLQC